VRDEERSVWQRKPEREQKEETEQSRWGFRGMTLRDWLELLIVPLVLLGRGLMFDLRQQGIEDQRAARERELEEQRAQDAVLQTYLDQMSELILNRNLLESEEGDAVYTLAQARTSTAIAGLDAEHNMSVARFLADSGLIGFGESSISILKDAWFRDANLRLVDLQQADLSGADLRRTNLGRANVSDADLSEADLSRAQGWTEDQLSEARTLEDATMPDGQTLKSASTPDGPTFEDWLKSKGREEDE
jgi:hypothetical protein